MEGHKQPDEEAAVGQSPLDGQVERYHDDSDDTDVTAADAPLRPTQRPSVDFETLGRPVQPTLHSRLSSRLPPGLKRAWAATVTWVKGPLPPRIYSIRPFFPVIQHFPLTLLDRYAPKRRHRLALLLLLYAAWLFSFSLVLWRSSFAASIPGHGSPVRLGCGSRYWSEGNGCGLNGDQCRPFANATLAFRCPADCHKTLVLNPHAVGDQEVVYKPLVVGGPADYSTSYEDEIVDNAIYRSDSFICASAVHAGFIKNIQGGCGVLTLTGEQPSFTSSNRHGLTSTGFDSYFPHTFAFLSNSQAPCKDLRWPALAVSVIFTTLLSLTTTSPAVFFWSIFTALFFHVALASDPPNLTEYYSLLSIALGRFLPACFCAAVTYTYTAKRTLTNLTAQVEKTVLWLGAAWVGALNNYTFDRIPIQRLTPHDIKAQPGAVPALITVVLSIFFIALGQAWAFRVEGRMPRYLLLYSIFVGGLLLMLAIPGESVRLHHYILALLLLPGTSFQNRPSLLYQGLLVGLFVNGVARWGFAPILETPGELLRGTQQGSLLPTVLVLASHAGNITFDLGALPIYDARRKTTYDGISVLVNDVERFRGYGDDSSYWRGDPPSSPDDFSMATADKGGNFTWTWHRHHVDGLDGVDGDVQTLPPEYFRFAYMAGSLGADFGKAGKWLPGGEWVGMKDGPSR